MPSLILMKAPDGAAPNKTIPLAGELMVIGRDADKCQIVIPHHAVSREHARITRSANGQFFIEDLKSRNHTFVNSKEVPPPARQQLKPDDRIKICDFLFRFHDERVVKPQDLPPWMAKGAEEKEEPDESGMTTIEATQGKGNAQQFLDIAPTDRLRALLDISQNLSRTLELEPLLNQIAETLFGVFKQADRCFVILLDEAGRPVPKVQRNRRPGMDDSRHSRTIVKKTIDSMQSYLSEDASSDANLGPAASIAEFKIRSVMCVPLSNSEGRALGAIQLDTQDRAKKFSSDDLNMLTIVANLAGVTVEKARLHETVLAREKEQKEIELARKVQLGFLPQTLPEVLNYEFYSHYSPAQTVGGDYYDFVTLPGGRVAVVLGDVAGKGVPAALLVAKLSSEVRFCLLTVPDLAQAVYLLNEQMILGGLGDRFVTLAVMVLDPNTHVVTMVSAGHMPPKIYRAATGKLVDALTNDETGVPIGVMPGYPFVQVRLTLEMGDSVAVFTDGVTEGMNPAGEVFGYAALERSLAPDDGTVQTAGSQRPRRMGERLVNAVRKHANGRTQNDDIAVVAFGRLESESGPTTDPNKVIPTTSMKIPM
ncbi:MAG: SpoIIE family protein phosphatase [Planctomycetia bacterium]|nr:SpoIIE family protein phosphatase [Planctomycetia bacterium]